MRKSILTIIALLIFSGSAVCQEVSKLSQEGVPQECAAVGAHHAELYAIDTSRPRNVLGWLFKDDPQYYNRAPIWVPLVKITLSNAALWAVDRYIFNYDFSRISLNSWSENLKRGWTWRDTDRFGNDFFFHPYTGGGYFNDARSLGYNFWESIPFAAFGSAEWKYFCENDQPSYADLINTTVNGTFVGEVAYRLTSNILDDRATGADRFWREFAVGLISPSRFFSRLITGKLWEQSNDLTLEKEPMDARLSFGPHLVNNGTQFGTGAKKISIDLMLDYGDPFEMRDRAAFDHFKLWGDVTNAYERKYLGGVTGYGNLFSGNSHSAGFDMMYGLFQHFDYFDNLTFEFGDVAFGPGIVTKVPIGNEHNIYFNALASFFPFGANNAHFFPLDSTQQRDYSYGDGLNAKAELGFSLFDDFIDIDATGMYILFDSYYGVPVNNQMLLVKPRLAFNVWHNLGLGVEDQIYYSNRFGGSMASGTIHQTEQRFFVQWNWNDFPHGQ